MKVGACSLFHRVALAVLLLSFCMAVNRESTRRVRGLQNGHGEEMKGAKKEKKDKLVKKSKALKASKGKKGGDGDDDDDDDDGAMSMDMGGVTRVLHELLKQDFPGEMWKQTLNDRKEDYRHSLEH